MEIRHNYFMGNRTGPYFRLIVSFFITGNVKDLWICSVLGFLLTKQKEIPSDSSKISLHQSFLIGDAIIHHHALGFPLEFKQRSLTH